LTFDVVIANVKGRWLWHSPTSDDVSYCVVTNIKSYIFFLLVCIGTNWTPELLSIHH